jgi:uncharacterized protein YdaU (DUF1376 family)
MPEAKTGTGNGGQRKAPAFQFYAADYLADESVQVMSVEEEGCFIRLLAYCWREGSIPADEDQLSRLCKGSNAYQTVIKRCFFPDPKNPSRLINQRLKIEAKKQEEFRKSKQRGGINSGKSRRATKYSTEHSSNSVQTEDEQNRTLQSSSSSSPTVVPSPPSPLQTGLEECAEKIHSQHPPQRRDLGKSAVRNRLMQILRYKRLVTRGGKARGKPLPYLVALATRHREFAESFEWTKEGGQYAKALSNWLAPRMERYEPPPPPADAPAPAGQPRASPAPKKSWREEAMPDMFGGIE